MFTSLTPIPFADESSRKIARIETLAPTFAEVLKQPRSVSPSLEALEAFFPGGHCSVVLMELIVVVIVSPLEENVPLDVLEDELEEKPNGMFVSIEELDEVWLLEESTVKP
jgi:hypothetical protein